MIKVLVTAIGETNPLTQTPRTIGDFRVPDGGGPAAIEDDRLGIDEKAD
jgi:hypothetical protein